MKQDERTGDSTEALRSALAEANAEIARLTADNDCGPWKSTRPMRKRAAELARARGYVDDYDRAVLAILEDFERLERLHVARLKAALSASPAPSTEGLREAARKAHDTLIEINPNNYTHDEVVALNAASVEAILLLADVLGERHGKTEQWWNERRTALAGVTAPQSENEGK